jgi:RNA polymerase sigma-70 factor (ECF subfamily)
MVEPVSDALQQAPAPPAFEAIVAGERRRVFGLAYSILRDRAAAEDVAQEVFVKVWHALPDYDGRAQLSTWIYAITRNTSISALRRRRAAASLSDPAVLAEAEAVSQRNDTIGADDAGLWRAVAALRDVERQCVTLYYQDERSVEDVAAMLGMPVNTVKTHLYRARGRLARALGGSARSKEDAA